MKTVRKTPKIDILVNLFEEVGDKVLLDTIYAKTGIKNYDSLKGLLSYIRKAKHIPDENRVDIRIDTNYCIRVKWWKRKFY